ncbi:MAG TPA: MBL fold metallo-hydrolase [Syntrophorhabdaceae bacterium]|nr:MBL fold metallo-hydrolase [Syntrophorhabdaceae bacterium]
MKIKWYGHSAFSIVTENGLRIIVDPYESGAFGGGINYGPIKDEADIVLTSHDHADHNFTGDIEGKFLHIRKPGSYTEREVAIRAVPVFHDKVKGKERGENLIFIISADGITLAHLGDLGHTLEENTLKGIGKVEILCIPVGGFFTIDAAEATKVMNDIGPLITIPMHYNTEKTDMPIQPVDEFIKGKAEVLQNDSAELVINREMLPRTNRVVIMKHAL